MTTPLDQRSLEDLQAASIHLEKIEAQVARESRMNPGPGWGPVIDILERNRIDLEQEIKRR